MADDQPIVGITRYYARKDSTKPDVVRHWYDKDRMALYVKQMRRAKKRVAVTEYHPT